jgi:hypothetical protein
VAALEAMNPDAVLIEGPPDAAEVLALAGAAEMKQPVALLVYPVDAPGARGVLPFAEFSPEWQAIRFGLARGIPVSFMDLPQYHRLAEAPLPDPLPEDGERGSDEDGDNEEEIARVDPIGALAMAAGFPDGELWWSTRSSGGGIRPGCSTACWRRCARCATNIPTGPGARICCARRSCARRSARR